MLPCREVKKYVHKLRLSQFKYCSRLQPATHPPVTQCLEHLTIWVWKVITLSPDWDSESFLWGIFSCPTDTVLFYVVIDNTECKFLIAIDGNCLCWSLWSCFWSHSWTCRFEFCFLRHSCSINMYCIFSIKCRGHLFKTRPHRAGVYLNLAFIRGLAFVNKRYFFGL